MDTCPPPKRSNRSPHAPGSTAGRPLAQAVPSIAFALFSIMPLPSASAEEMLEISITAPEGQFEIQQPLGPGFETYTSGPLVNETEGNRKRYSAIRCDGLWGAMKYDVALVSGPGIRLRASESRLLLQILEHRVQSQDQNIDAMKMHCRDTEPKTIQHSVAEIELVRGDKASKEIPLINGYLLSLHYMP